MTRSGKSGFTCKTIEIHCLSIAIYVKDALIHYPEIPSVLPLMAKSAYTDGFLPMLLSHKDAFLGLERY